MNIRYSYSIFITLFFFLSCQNPFNPTIKLDINREQAKYYTPDEVLRTLITAYNQKSIDLYKSILDKGFVFHVLIQNQPELGVNYWGYNEEIEYHKNLFANGSSDGKYQSPDYISLNLMIPPESDWKIDQTVGQENWVIILCNFNLLLKYSNRSDITAHGSARYFFKYDNDRWYIAKWVDESNI